MQERQPLQYNGISENEDPNHDIFTDPTLSRTIKEDPLVQFFFKWWRQVVTVVIAAFAVFYIKEAFHNTYVASMQRSAELYTNVQAEYVAYKVLKQEEQTLKTTGKEQTEEGVTTADLEKRLSETKGRMQEMLTALKEAKEPYSRFAAIYTGLVDLADGNAKTYLNLSDDNKWKSFGVGSDQRFFAELESLTKARILLDADGKSEEGRSLLLDLANNGTTVNVSAAVSLANIASTPKEFSEALAMLKNIKKTSPKQTVLLKEHISRLEELVVG